MSPHLPTDRETRILVDVSDRPDELPFGTICFIQSTAHSELSPGDFVITESGDLKRLRMVLSVGERGARVSGQETLSGPLSKVIRAEYRGSNINLSAPQPLHKWWRFLKKRLLSGEA